MNEQGHWEQKQEKEIVTSWDDLYNEKSRALPAILNTSPQRPNATQAGRPARQSYAVVNYMPQSGAKNFASADP